MLADDDGAFSGIIPNISDDSGCMASMPPALMPIKRTAAQPASMGNRSHRNTLGAAFRHLLYYPMPGAKSTEAGYRQEGLTIMDREQARQEIRSEWRRLIEVFAAPAKRRVNGETSYICPICNHGEHGDGLTLNPRSKSGYGLKCFGCGFSGDIIDLYMQLSGDSYNAALSVMAESIGISIDPYRPTAADDFRTPADAQKRPQEAQRAANDKQHGKQQETPTEAKTWRTDADTDYTAYYRECRDRINAPAAIAYLQERGISAATAAAYWVGYDPAADPANAPGAIGEQYKPHPAPRLIIPTTKSHYIGRAIDPNTPKQYAKMNPNRDKGAGTAGIFNQQALYAQGVQEVFITEGAFDALSIIEAGAAAIALNSTSNTAQLIKMLEQRPTPATLILCLDNDDAGAKAAETLKDGLRRLNIGHITADICGKYKDPNEHLTGNKAEFVEAVQMAQRQTAARPDNISYYIDNLMTGEIARFKSEIKTGFDNLDKLAGGLYSGLYVIAAISSLGKTTFAAQMADNIAASGNDVLFFSMEQSRLEMVSKSIARRTFINDKETAVSSLSIRRGYLPEQVLNAAEQLKQEVQERISIIEGNFNCNISFIGDYIRQYIRRNTGKRPVCIIDYLQVLQPEQQNNRLQTTKETIDSSITELKRISRELDVTVFVISSVNRANYLTPIDFEALKESGSIEYTADVIWGLQLQCLNDPIFDKQNNIKERREKVKAAKAATPRKIELSCLKNRYGIANYSAYFNYYPANDYFESCSDAELDFTPVTATGRKAMRKV